MVAVPGHSESQVQQGMLAIVFMMYSYGYGQGEY
jgi:hypothetical protein